MYVHFLLPIMNRPLLPILNRALIEPASGALIEPYDLRALRWGGRPGPRTRSVIEP
jgi:hypothetical protein